MARVKTVTPVRYLGQINYIEVLVSSLDTNTVSYYIINCKDSLNQSKWGQLMNLLGRVPSFESRLATLEAEIDNHEIMISLHKYKKHVNLFVVQ